MPDHATVRRIYDAINAALKSGDIDLLDAAMHPDAVDHNPAPGQGPGLDGIKSAFAEFRTAFPDLHLTVEDVIVEGDKAAVRITTSGTHRGPFAGLEPTNRPVHQSGIDFLRVVDGKIAERWGEFDNLSLMQQLGAIP